MTKKDYILLADCIKSFDLLQQTNPNYNCQITGSFIKHLSNYLYNQNNRFDYNKFYKACQR